MLNKVQMAFIKQEMGHSSWTITWLDQLKCSYPLTSISSFLGSYTKKKIPNMRGECMFPALFIINNLHVNHYKSSDL